VRHADDSPVALDLIGSVYRQLGDREAAGRWYERALERNAVCVKQQINLANNHIIPRTADDAND